MKTRDIAGIIAGAVALTVAVSAVADNSFYPAAGCQPQQGSIQYNNDGSISNPGTTTLQVMCPIDRGPFGSTQKLQAAAFVFSNAPNHVTCDAASTNAQTGSFFATGDIQNVGDGTRESLPFPSIGHHGSFDVDYMSCLIDPGGVLLGYRGIEE